MKDLLDDTESLYIGHGAAFGASAQKEGRYMPSRSFAISSAKSSANEARGRRLHAYAESRQTGLSWHTTKSLQAIIVPKVDINLREMSSLKTFHLTIQANLIKRFLHTSYTQHQQLNFF